jgi:hypothetical protein
MNTTPPNPRLDLEMDSMGDPPPTGLAEGLPLRTIGIVAGAVVVVAAAGTWMLLHRHSSPAAPARVVTTSPPAAAPTPLFQRSVAAPVHGDVQPKSVAQPALARAQSQIEAGKPKTAEKTLASVLRRKKLPRSDRAMAFRLMGAAEARRGHRKAAIAWYRKSLKTTEDAGERDRIAQHIRQLTKARKTADVIAAVDSP